MKYRILKPKDSNEQVFNGQDSKYIKRHRRLLFLVVIYILIRLMKSRFAPWSDAVTEHLQIGGDTAYGPAGIIYKLVDVDRDNPILGLSDLVTMMFYGNTMFHSNNPNERMGMYYHVVPGILIIFSIVAQYYVLKKLHIDLKKTFDKVEMFLWEGIISYISCLMSYAVTISMGSIVKHFVTHSLITEMFIFLLYISFSGVLLVCFCLFFFPGILFYYIPIIFAPNLFGWIRDLRVGLFLTDCFRFAWSICFMLFFWPLIVEKSGDLCVETARKHWKKYKEKQKKNL